MQLGFKLVLPGRSPGQYVGALDRITYHAGWQHHPAGEKFKVGITELVPLYPSSITDQRRIARAQLIMLECENVQGNTATRVRVAPAAGARGYVVEALAKAHTALLCDVLAWAAMAGEPAVLQNALNVLQTRGSEKVIHTINNALAIAVKRNNWTCAAPLARALGERARVVRQPVLLNATQTRTLKRRLRDNHVTFQDHALHALDGKLVIPKQGLQPVNHSRALHSFTVRLPWDRWVRVLTFLERMQSEHKRTMSVRTLLAHAVMQN